MDDAQYPDLSGLIGKPVRLTRTDAESAHSTEEFGYIIHAWMDNEIDVIDCYVAFFGTDWPEIGVKPDQKPYVLRYFLSSLDECET